MIDYSSNWGDELLEAVLFLLAEGAKVNNQNTVKINFIIDDMILDE